MAGDNARCAVVERNGSDDLGITEFFFMQGGEWLVADTIVALSLTVSL